MPREAGLFDETGGSALEGYLLLKRDGGNIPPMWIKRARLSRKRREKELAATLKKKSLDAGYLLRDWELASPKEFFYHVIRVLMVHERGGQAKL